MKWLRIIDEKDVRKAMSLVGFGDYLSYNVRDNLYLFNFGDRKLILKQFEFDEIINNYFYLKEN